MNNRWLQSENGSLLKKVQRLRSLRAHTILDRQFAKKLKAKSPAAKRSRDWLDNRQESPGRGQKALMSTRSLSNRKRKQSRDSSNSDLFTLVPKELQQNPYKDVIAGPDGQAASARKPKNGSKMPPRSPSPVFRGNSASRLQLNNYMDTCERLERELSCLRLNQSQNIATLTDRNHQLLLDVEQLKATLRQQEAMIEKLVGLGPDVGEADYEGIIKTNEDLREGRDNFRARYLEEREARKDLEMRIKRVEKECKAKVGIIQQSLHGQELRAHMQKIHSPSHSGDEYEQQDQRIASAAASTGRKQSIHLDYTQAQEHFNDRLEHSEHSDQRVRDRMTSTR